MAACPSHQAHARRLAVLLGASAALAGALGACHDDGPTGPSPFEARLAFVSDRDGNPELYTAREDGSDVRRLTNDPARDESPAWAPDRRRLAFVSDRDGNAELYVVNADGTGLRRLTYDPATDGSPAWAPDGRRLAFASDRAGGVAQLFVVDADAAGATPVQITTGAGANLDPSWSPDGTRLAYAHADGVSTIFVVNADGTAAAPLDATTATSAPGVAERAPVWSPDGRSIAFVARVPLPQMDWIDHDQLFVTRADGTGRTQLTAAVDGSGPYATEPSWSTDGRRIVFTGNRDAAQPELYSMAADGTDIVRLTRSPAAFLSDAAWSPDGARIAALNYPNAFGRDFDARASYQSVVGPATELYVMNRDGGGLQRLLGEPAPGAGYGRPAWAPDGRRLALVGGGSAPTLLVLNADGSGRRDVALTPGATYAGPDWSPDGRRLALIRRGTVPALLVVNADGGGTATLEADVDDGSPLLWSPDGNQLAVAARLTGDSWKQVYVADVDGSRLTRLTQPDAAPGYRAYEPSDWSPDGATLLVLADSTIAMSVRRVFALDRASGALTQLTFALGSPYERQSGPRYSPDGRRLAFLASGGVANAVYLVNADGSGRRLLASAGERSFGSVHWSPDGSRIAAAYSGSALVFRPGIAVLDVDGGGDTNPGAGRCSSTFHPTWDEAGRELLFDCYFGSRGHELFVARLADGALTPLTDGSPTSSYGPAWAP